MKRRSQFLVTIGLFGSALPVMIFGRSIAYYPALYLGVSLQLAGWCLVALETLRVYREGKTKESCRPETK